MKENKKVEVARAAVRQFRTAGTLLEPVEGLQISVHDKGTSALVQIGSETFMVTGNQRLMVRKVSSKQAAPKAEREKPMKPKIDSAPVGPTIDATCSECGKTFQLSKFTPYLTVCYECRKEFRKERKMLPTTSTIKLVDKATGKTFVASKYNPYLEVAPKRHKLA